MIRIEWEDVRAEEESSTMLSQGFFFAVAELLESSSNAAARPGNVIRKPASPRRVRLTRSLPDTASSDIDPDATRLLRHAAPLRSAL